MISVTVQIDHDSGIPLHRQIADGIERAVDSGQLRRDRNLPSVRELSSRAMRRAYPSQRGKSYPSRSLFNLEGSRQALRRRCPPVESIAIHGEAG